MFKCKFLFYFFLITFLNSKIFALADPSLHSIPREYFSMHIVNFGDYQVQVGKDEINNAYIILPSPKVRHIQSLPNGQKAVNLDLYPTGINEYLSQKFNTPNVEFLYLLSLNIYDNTGGLVKSLFIPDGVSLAPPQYLEFEVSSDVTELTVIYSFIGRSGWSDFGVAADARGLYEELRKLNVNSNNQLSLDINAEDGKLSTFEIFNSAENNIIEKAVSFFQNFVLWGNVPDKILDLIQELDYAKPVKIDFSDYVNDLNSYPQIFTDMNKWQSAIKTLAAEKYSENELNEKLSDTINFAFKDLFNLGSSSSEEKMQRVKKIFKFNLEGDVYVPKSINFVLRKQHALDLVKGALIKSYKDLQEQKFKFGSTIILKNPKTVGFPISVKCSGPNINCGTKANFVIEGGSRIRVNLKTYPSHCAAIAVDVYVDDVLKTQLGPFTYLNATGEFASYKRTDSFEIPFLSPQDHKISLEAKGIGGCSNGILEGGGWAGNLELVYNY